MKHSFLLVHLPTRIIAGLIFKNVFPETAFHTVQRHCPIKAKPSHVKKWLEKKAQVQSITCQVVIENDSMWCCFPVLSHKIHYKLTFIIRLQKEHIFLIQETITNKPSPLFLIEFYYVPCMLRWDSRIKINIPQAIRLIIFILLYESKIQNRFIWVYQYLVFICIQ